MVPHAEACHNRRVGSLPILVGYQGCVEFQVGRNICGSHVDNFTDANFEACNGQLRSFLEDLTIGVARRRGQQQQAKPLAALDHLQRAGVLDREEWNVFRALWSAAQDNGPHAGLTDAEEARFRLHTATAAGRYLLKKVPE